MEWLFPSEPLDKRLKVSLDYNHRILQYGTDNLYPQRMEQIRLRSPLLVSATNVLGDFINGSGFEINNHIVLNQQSETSKDLLNLAAMDYSRYAGFAFHINFDGTGRITEVQHIPFQYCRLGIPDEHGIVNNVVVSNNWEEDSDKQEGGGKARTTWYPIFNPLKAADETLFIPQPKGQVLYYTGQERWKYPLTTYDSIRDTGLTDAAIQKYESANTNKGFHGATIFRYPGKFESHTQKAEIVDQVRKMMGPDSPGVTVAQIDEDFTGALMEQIPAGSDDALFSTTLGSILDRVMYHYNIPPALFGVSPAGGVFTQLAYQESFIVYNVSTRNKRDEVARVFNKIAALWHQQEFTFGRIIENEFEIQSVENEKVANRYTGPTDEQLNAGAEQIAAENLENQTDTILKPTKEDESGGIAG
jgi:hypothetical protein